MTAVTPIKAPDTDIIERMSRDIRDAAKRITLPEARFLVDLYYDIQEQRIRTGNQAKALERSGEPNLLVNFFKDQHVVLETRLKQTLDAFTKMHPLGVWPRSIPGIGPVLAAGLIAHIDISKAPTAGHIWSYAGLDPTKEWKKGEKRPWNAALKLIAYKIGESFIKVKSNENDIYGKLYDVRKTYETAKNEAGEYADYAASILAKKRIGTDTETYAALTQGKLSKGHIHARCRRYAVKMFLSHLQYAWYVATYHTEPPKPFAIEILGHAHLIEVPNRHLITHI